MSEYINNSERRKEVIKSIITQLHHGKSVDEVKAEFGELLKTASSSDIAAVEQQLIQEGLPVEEVQRLCDVHVAVFRENLDQEVQPESIPGHPVFTYKAENQLLNRVLDEMDVTFENYITTGNSALVQTLRQQVNRLLEFIRHYERKENQLFPYLEKHQFYGPSRVMWGIHDQIRAMIKKLAGMLMDTRSDRQEIATLYKDLSKEMREMVYKEEKILFPGALERLTEEDWAFIRNEENQIGFFMVTPGNQWKPKITLQGEDMQTTSGNSEGMISLSTGELTPEQVNIMLTSLPVDITFVDENDRVRYFSQTPDRLFPRSPAIIGREVQHCHPAASVDKVQKIIDDFRTGKRRVAEFWIKMAGKYINIRYFAMHDDQGKYRGTLEVSQEISHIRELEGEKRLLDD